MTELIEKKAPPKTDMVELRRRLSTLPAKKRMEAILECPDVIRVVRQLPVQDIYTTIREIGRGDALEVVELLSPQQVQGFLDLDGWRRDRLDPGSIGEWFEALFSANAERAVSQLRGIDVELFTLLLKLHAQVHELEEDEDPVVEDIRLHSITTDRRFLVVYLLDSADERMLQGLKYTVDRLYERDPTYMGRLLESVRWEVASSLEEEAYRWRNGRLADLGFLDIGEAHEMFAFIDPDGEATEVPATPPALDSDDLEAAQVNLSTSVLLPWDALGEGGHALGAAMARTSSSTQERLLHELMLVSNRLHVAAGGDIGDTSALKATVKRALDTVGIGLSYLTQGDGEKAPGILERAVVLRLFQVGNSVVLRIGRRLRTLMREPQNGLSDNAILRLDAPLRETVAGVLQKQPVFFAGLLDDRRSDFVAYSSLLEIAEATRAVSEAAFRAALLGPGGLGADDLLIHENGDDPARPTHGMLLASALCLQILGEPLLPRPLSDDQLATLFRRLESDDDGHRAFTDDDEARALDALAKIARAAAPLPGAPTADEAEARARTYGKRVLAQLESELSEIKDDTPDPRYVTAVWTKAGVQPADDDEESA